MNTDSLAPAPVRAACAAPGRFRFGFGRRFVFLLILGAGLAVPGFWDRVYLIGLLAWDLLLLVAWWIDLMRLPKPGELIVERLFQSAPSLDDVSNVQLTLHDSGATAIHCTLTDATPPSWRDVPPELPLLVRAGQEEAASYAIQPRARGDAPLGGVFLRYESELHLAQRWAFAPLQQTVRVYPSLENTKSQGIYLTRSRRIELEKRRARQRGSGKDFESLREFREGDELRNVCWTATARRGKLVTKVHQIERSQSVWLVMDQGRLMRSRVGRLSKLDYAADAALGVAHLALQSGDRVGLVAYGRHINHRVGLGRGPGHMKTLLEELAQIDAEASEADHLRAAGLVQSMQSRRSLVIWLTDIAETSMRPEVIEGAAHLLPRHVVLFMVMAQPDLNELAARRPVNAHQMYESAAAQEVALRRELLLAQLRERGALALEVAPHGLSAALLNQYLYIKERGLL